jgi:hypothetical protein
MVSAGNVPNIERSGVAGDGFYVVPVQLPDELMRPSIDVVNTSVPSTWTRIPFRPASLPHPTPIHRSRRVEPGVSSRFSP